MSPASACPPPGAAPGGPHPAPRPLATPRPTFGDPQLHGAALVLVLVPHGVRVAGGPRGSAPGGAGYMAAPAGAGASWCRLRGPRRAPAPPPAPRPARPESGGWNVTAPGCGWAGAGGAAPSARGAGGRAVRSGTPSDPPGDLGTPFGSRVWGPGRT